jgi:transmembrane protein TMEM220
MRIFNFIFFLLFVFSAALQYNDPDPYVWMPIYLYGAVLCFLAFRGKYYPRAYLIGIAVYLVYAGYLVFTKDGVLDWINQHNAESLVQTMKAEKPWIEDTREFGGLMILVVVLLIDYFYSRRKVHPPAP